MLDRDRDADRVAHGLHAVSHKRGRGHQAGAERAFLHPVRRTAAVQVDFVVAPILAGPGRAREGIRLVAAQLQRDRMLGAIEIEVPGGVAVEDRAGGDHLGIKAGMRGQQPMEEAAVAVGPIDHGRDTQFPAAKSLI